MTITKFIQTRNLRGLINYVKTSENENDRVAYFSSLNTSFSNAENEMLNYIQLLGKQDMVQGFHIIQSFDSNELDPNDELNYELANKAGLELAKRMYPNNQVLVVTQIDGKSGLIHNHICGNQSNLIDGKSLRNNQKNHYHIAKTSDEVLHDLQIKNVLEGKKAYYRDDKSYNEEYVRNQEKYLYKDDLRERLDDVLKDKPTSFDEFVKNLELMGVDVKLNNRGDDYQYHFRDFYRKNRHAMGKRLDKSKYSKDEIDSVIEQNAKEHQRKLEIQRQQIEIQNRIQEGIQRFKTGWKSMFDRWDETEPEIEKSDEIVAEPVVEPIVEKRVKKRIPNRPKPVETKVEEVKKPMKTIKVETVEETEISDAELMRQMNAALMKHGLTDTRVEKSNDIEFEI
ncbi:TPA: relaxase/mobilization nuclease domain-containing protein [Streptococcus suis]